MKRHAFLVLLVFFAVLTSTRFASAQIATTTAVTSTANPSAYGQYVRFTVTVTPVGSIGEPTGIAWLTIDGTSHMLMLQPPGTAMYPVAVLGLGPHVIEATYTGDATFAPSDAPTLNQVVNPAGTVTTLTGTPNPASFGDTVRVGVQVASAPPGGGVPSGTVAVTRNGDLLGIYPLDPAGYAFLSIAPPAGANDFVATYNGATGYSPSVGLLTESVSQGYVYTELYVSPDPAVYGETVTLRARLSPAWPASATATGAITFSGDGLPPVIVPVVDNMATTTTNTLAVGPHTFTAAYSGSTNYLPSSSYPATATVNASATTTTVASSWNPSLVGQPVTFTATVTPQWPGAGTPTGVVLFSDGATPLGTVPLTAGAASFTISTLASGAHAISASYLGDACFLASDGSGPPQNVVAAAATVLLAAKPSPATFGDPITLTATVTGTPFQPTGTVDFLDGATLLAGGVKLDPSGQAIISIGLAPVGKHTYVARYSGDPNYGTASGSILAYVDPAPVTMDFTTSVNPAVTGQAVTLTVVLGVPKGGPDATGLVHFFDDGKEIGQSGSSKGMATLATFLKCGAHAITAHYDGDLDYKPGDAALSGNPLQVDPGSTGVVVTSSQNPAAPTQTVTFTASVSVTAPATGAPGGTVTFLDGSTPLAAVAVSSGIASYACTLPPGSHDIRAVYSGDADFAGSTAALSGGPQVVQAGSTGVTVIATPAAPSYGTSVTLTATVGASTGGGTPGGTVTFRDGSGVIATVPLVSGRASCVVRLTSAGPHTWFADYGGDATFAAATGSQTVVAGRGAVDVMVSSSLNPAPSGGAFSLRTRVSFAGTADGLATPTGIVTFYDGSGVLGTSTLDASGAATLTTASTVSGDHVIHVAYAGDVNYDAGGSSALTQTIAPPPITVVVNAATVVLENGAATYTITVAATDGFDSEVVFACSGLPAGLSYRFDPPTAPPGTGPVTTRLTVFPVATAATSANGALVVALLGMIVAVALGRRPLVRVACTCALAVVLVVLCTAGCGGGGGTTGVPQSGGQAVSTSAGVSSGTYPFTVTATSGAKSVSQALTVTVP